MKYPIKFFGKQFLVSKFVIWSMIIPCIAFTCFLFAGLYRFGEDFLGSGLLFTFIVVALSSSIEISGDRYAFLPENKLLNILKGVISWASVAYFIFYLIG